jgi:glycosyltransferase involved in cell wall biosynthesis
VVPVYNGAAHLAALIPRCKAVVSTADLLFINDGSSDDTLDRLKAANVNYISFEKNRGKGAALLAGFAFARQYGYRSVLTLDCDLQHPPEDIPRFIAADDGCAVIIGTRDIRLGQVPPTRWFSNNLTSLIVSVFSGRRVRDSQSGYRLIPVRLLAAIRLTAVDYDLESELLFKAGALGCAVGEVSVATIYEGSSSHIHPLVDTFRFIRQVWKRIWA